MSRGQVLVFFFNRYSTTVNLVKKKQGGPIKNMPQEMDIQVHQASRQSHLVFGHLP